MGESLSVTKVSLTVVSAAGEVGTLQVSYRITMRSSSTNAKRYMPAIPSLASFMERSYQQVRRAIRARKLLQDLCTNYELLWKWGTQELFDKKKLNRGVLSVTRGLDVQLQYGLYSAITCVEAHRNHIIDSLVIYSTELIVIEFQDPSLKYKIHGWNEASNTLVCQIESGSEFHWHCLQLIFFRIVNEAAVATNCLSLDCG
jgi:hypothetical protein